jgi:hypothetical protein
MERKIPLKSTMLKQELLNELREIVKDDFGENLSDKELFEFGSNLLSYFELLAKIYFREKESFEDNSIKMPQNLTFPLKHLK